MYIRRHIRPKASKYKAISCTVDGIRFDSRKEAEHYGRLKLLQRAGEITGFERQVTYPLYAWTPLARMINSREMGFPKVCDHRVDFVVTLPDGTKEVHEVKGFATDVWMLKRKLFEANYPEIPYMVIR